MDKRPNIKKRIALELFRSIKKNRAKLHELRTLFWECTLRCNVSCRHCGSDCHVSASVPDMPVEDFLKVIDDITPYVEPNKVLVIFTGGEALVRKDIEKCGLELYRRGYPWGIVSNGYLMTRERLDSLLASGLHSATISLDGFEEAHNWLRRNPKSFEKALNAICMLAEEKEIIWDVVTCVNQRNFKDLMLFKDFLIEMGVKRWRIFTIFPVGRAATETDLQLTNEQFTWVMNFIRFCRKEGKIHVSYGCEGFLGNYEAEVETRFSNATPVSIRPLSSLMALSPVVPVYGRTSTKGTSIKTISLISGIMSLNRIVTASGLKKGNARIVRCSVIAKATGCTYTMMRGICSYATIKG